MDSCLTVTFNLYFCCISRAGENGSPTNQLKVGERIRRMYKVKKEDWDSITPLFAPPIPIGLNYEQYIYLLGHYATCKSFDQI